MNTNCKDVTDSEVRIDQWTHRTALYKGFLTEKHSQKTVNTVTV